MNSLIRTILIIVVTMQYTLCTAQKANDDTPPQASENEYAKRGLKDIFEGEPGKAALYSLVLPGAGQAYNKRWWKMPIAIGVEGLFIYNIINKRRKFKNLDTKWRDYIYFGGPPIPNYCNTPLSQSQIKNDRDDARQAMEYSWVYWGITHLVVTLEAFINRHLMEFDISDDLSLKYKLETTPSEIETFQVHALSVQFSF